MNTSAEEKLRQIAQQLVAAREAQGMPLEEVATKTFIPIRILKALEAAETFKLPESIFVQGFIKRYAKLVGLDGDALAREIPLDQTPIAVNIVKEPAARALVPPINKRVSLDEPTAKRPRESIFSKIAPSPDRSAAPQEPIDRPAWLLPVLGGLAGFGLLVGAIALMTNRPQPVTTTPSPSTSPSTKAKASIKPSPSVSPSESPRVEPSAIASPTPSSSPSSSPAPNLTTGPVNVVLNLSDDSWVEVKSDGKVVFEGTMAKGSNQNWSAQKEIEVTSGNAGAVTVSQNQKPGKVMGSVGDVKTTTFSGR